MFYLNICTTGLNSCIIIDKIWEQVSQFANLKYVNQFYYQLDLVLKPDIASSVSGILKSISAISKSTSRESSLGRSISSKLSVISWDTLPSLCLFTAASFYQNKNLLQYLSSLILTNLIFKLFLWQKRLFDLLLTSLKLLILLVFLKILKMLKHLILL